MYLFIVMISTSRGQITILFHSLKVSLIYYKALCFHTTPSKWNISYQSPFQDESASNVVNWCDVVFGLFWVQFLLFLCSSGEVILEGSQVRVWRAWHWGVEGSGTFWCINERWAGFWLTSYVWIVCASDKALTRYVWEREREKFYKGRANEAVYFPWTYWWT